MNQACRSLDSTIDDSSLVKVSLRQWIRLFAWLRNRTRGHGSPKSATLSTVCPALESSLEEILVNAPVFRRSWAHLKRNLSGKYRVSRFGGDREQFEYLIRNVEHSLPDGTYVFLDAPRSTRLFFTDPDLTDFLLPNGNYRSVRFEIASYITDERRTEDGSLYALPVQAQPASETTATTGLELISDTFTNIPPRRDGFIPRRALQVELGQVLRDQRNPVVTLQGRGGVGKTSLALEVLHQMAMTGGVFTIIWFSARDIDLLPDGPRVVRADVLSTDDVARDFTALMRPNASTNRSDAQKFLTECLSGQAEDSPIIFVFDNFETLREQDELYAYLNNAIRLPNKVLITTRTRDFKGDHPIVVRGMERSEYHELVDETSTKLNIRHLLDSEYENQLYDESDGHPYITKVLLGEVAHEGRRASLKRVVATKDAMLDALFDRTFAALSPAGQRVFLTLCSWRSLVPRIGLEAVLLRPGNERLDVERAVSELSQSSLVEDLRDPASDSSFLSVPLAAALFGRKKLVSSPLKIAIDADLELVRGFGATTMAEMAHGLGPRIDKLTRAIARRVSSGAADLRQEIAVIEYIATEYPPAWLNLAELQQELDQAEEAIHSVNRYLESRPDDQVAWRRLIVLYRTSDDALGEMHARLQLAELAKPLFDELSSSASRLNGLFSRRELELDADERRLMIGKLRSLMEARHEEADATDLSRLAWLCIHEKDTDAAERWVSKGLATDPQNQHCLKLQRRLTSSRPGAGDANTS